MSTINRGDDYFQAVTYLEAAGYGLKTTEDEFGNVIPPSEAEQHLVRIMSTAPSWCTDLPVACEAGYATNYGDT